MRRLRVHCVWLLRTGISAIAAARLPAAIKRDAPLPNAELVDKVKTATRDNLDMEWLKPFMTKRACQAGEKIFSKDDVAAVMYYTLTGRYRLTELDQIVGPGEVVGELGLISPDNKRTQTFECIETGELLTLSYDSVRQLYFRNPKFGFYFLRVMGQRLFRDLQKLEQKLTPSARLS